METFRKYFAELLGTFVLVFVGCGVATATGCSGSPNSSYVLTALAFGGVLGAMVYVIGSISGCHVNPAVSLAMVLQRKISVVDFVCYVVAQCLGAILGALLLMAIFGTGSGLGSNHIFNSNIGLTLVIEAVLTCIFVLVVLGATSHSGNAAAAGLAIGVGLMLVHLLGIALTGTSVNPARSLGPALLAGGEALSSVWVFIVGPLVGGILAAVIWQVLGAPED